MAAKEAITGGLHGAGDIESEHLFVSKSVYKSVDTFFKSGDNNQCYEKKVVVKIMGPKVKRLEEFIGPSCVKNKRPKKHNLQEVSIGFTRRMLRWPKRVTSRGFVQTEHHPFLNLSTVPLLRTKKIVWDSRMGEFYVVKRWPTLTWKGVILDFGAKQVQM